jgi:hypothetical protein
VAGAIELYGLQLFIAEGLLGYFLQCSSYIGGICVVARRKIKPLPFLIASVIPAVATYLVRILPAFNFGVHTMLILLVVNIICILFLKIDVKYSVLGSLLVTVMVLGVEMINLGVLSLFFDQAQIKANMLQPLFKAWAGVPGNLILGISVTIAYILRVVKGKKKDGKAG